MRETPSQPDRALAAVLDGANTSEDIALELGVSRPHARIVVNRLLKEGLLRWTGRRIPPAPGSCSHGLRVYEAAR